MSWTQLQDMLVTGCVNTFGITVLYQPLGLAPVSITAIFDEAYQAIDPDTGASIISTQPMIMVRLADLPRDPGPGDTVQINSKNFRVNDSQVDGGGGAKILLQSIP